jgi:hypothetical protein
MRKDILAANDRSAFFELKLSHARLNRSKRERAMKERADKLHENFLGRKIITQVGPWVKETCSGMD